ncbi:endoglucanase [Chitinispirillum alkaliphilum]|nr:endoglucanase [Chitinispirillum alkaliphilum]
MHRLKVLLAAPLLLVSMLSAEIHIRHNHAGYQPVRPKSLVLISNNDLQNKDWKITRDGEVVMSGKVDESVTGAGPHTSHDFNHVVDFTDLEEIGEYTFKINGAQATIKIDDNPYTVFITDALRHLRNARSGSEHAILYGLSHPGDSAAIVHVIDGEPSEGRWKKASPKQTVDALGGWYDAGDYIKFTLTIANTTYHLLEAWEANPKAFTKVISPSDLPDVLDEALHGLNYLMKTHPDPDIFIIQVGDGDDHRQGYYRLPTHDALDGQRPALTAISPVQMGVAAASLAKGSRVFRDLGETEKADEFLEMAIKIFNRARQPDALDEPAFERDATNDFYRDDDLIDNMALGAMELYHATQEQEYLDYARVLEAGAGEWMGWTKYNFNANFGLAEFDDFFRDAVIEDIDHFVGNMDPVWGIPLAYVWASMHNWNAVGAAAGITYRDIEQNPAYLDLHTKMVDLLFGRSNWGVTFLANTRLDNSVRNIYSQTYVLTGEFPYGAVALGPGDRETHTAMEQYFGKPPASHLDDFQTAAASFYDWNKNFMTMETCVYSQTYAIWMLAVASNPEVQAEPDSSLPPYEGVRIKEASITPFDVNNVNWYVYADNSAGGNSRANIRNAARREALLRVRPGIQWPYTGFGFTFPANKRDLSAYDGMIIRGFFEPERTFRIDLGMASITDHSFHNKVKLGHGEETELVLLFDDMHRSWGGSIPLDLTDISMLHINFTSPGRNATVRVDEIKLFNIEE